MLEYPHHVANADGLAFERYDCAWFGDLSRTEKASRRFIELARRKVKTWALRGWKLRARSPMRMMACNTRSRLATPRWTQSFVPWCEGSRCRRTERATKVSSCLLVPSRFGLKPRTSRQRSDVVEFVGWGHCGTGPIKSRQRAFVEAQPCTTRAGRLPRQQVPGNWQVVETRQDRIYYSINLSLSCPFYDQ